MSTRTINSASTTSSSPSALNPPNQSGSPEAKPIFSPVSNVMVSPVSKQLVSPVSKQLVSPAVPSMGMMNSSSSSSPAKTTMNPNAENLEYLCIVIFIK